MQLTLTILAQQDARQTEELISSGLVKQTDEGVHYLLTQIQQ